MRYFKRQGNERIYVKYDHLYFIGQLNVLQYTYISGTNKQIHSNKIH